MTKKILMKNLICTGCADKIEKKVNRLSVVKSATFNFASQTMVMEVLDHYDPQTDFKKIQSIVDSVESGVETIPYEQRHDTHVSTFFKSYRLIVIGLLIFGIGTLLGYYDIYRPRNNFLYWIGYTLIAHRIIMNTYKGLKTKQLFNENVLIFVATLAAMLVEKPFEAAAVILFYSVGEHLQNRAVNRSKDEISSLMDLHVESVSVCEGDTVVLKDPLLVKKGDIIRVKNGEKIPVDAHVIKGTSSLNTSALSGESKLKTVAPGDSVLSGTINVGDVLELKATKEYHESTIAQIIDLIENATNKKTKTEQFITKFARIYTPLVTGFAVLMVIIPSLLNPAQTQDYIFRAATFLVISCPCALVLSIPLSYYAGIGRSAKEGILFKGSHTLDAMNSVDYIGFDKTGTLTAGNFVVHDYTNQQTLAIAASIEQYSNHPLAKGLLKAFDGPYESFDTIKEMPGFGLKATKDSDHYLVGSLALLRQENITAPQQMFDQTGTNIFVAKNHTYIGHIVLKDTLRPSSIKTIEALKKFAHITMFTGDNEATAQEIAQTLGNINYHHSLLPGEKILAFDAYKNTGSSMYVGDGINDAPLLKSADIGVSISEGSELAIDVADVIVMNNDLSLIERAFQISKKTRRIVLQNIVLTLGFKALFLGLASVGRTTMIMAIFADVGIALIAIFNALRIIYSKGDDHRV